MLWVLLARTAFEHGENNRFRMVTEPLMWISLGVLADDVIIECDTPTPLEVGGDVIGMRERTSAKLSKLPVRVVDYYSPPPT